MYCFMYVYNLIENTVFLNFSVACQVLLHMYWRYCCKGIQVVVI